MVGEAFAQLMAARLGAGCTYLTNAGVSSLKMI